MTAPHALRVEVQIAAAIETPGGDVLGNNVVDVAWAFAIAATAPPSGVTDAQINKVLTFHLSPVIAAIRTVFTESLGFVALGQIEETMASRSTPTGEFGRSTPVRVHMVPPAPGDGGRPS